MFFLRINFTYVSIRYKWKNLAALRDNCVLHRKFMAWRLTYAVNYASLKSYMPFWYFENQIQF